MEMGIEFSAYLRYVAALIFVLVLIWVASLLLKRGMGRRLGLKHSSEASLKIVEVLPIDSRHKMVLVQHRDREHLLLLGTDHALAVSELTKKQTTTAEEAITETKLATAKKEPIL